MEQRRPRTFLWTYLGILILALGLVAWGGYRAWKVGEWSTFALGSLGTLIVLSSWPIAAMLREVRGESRAALEQKLNGISDTLDQVSVLLNLVSEQQLLSDRAKSVAFREKERDALRRAIQEEIGRHDWEAALALASEIENGFGYKSEADRFRGEINQRRSEAIRRQINDAIAGIDRHMRGENWGAANREAERLMQIFPADEQVQRLPQDIENRRRSHKRQLEVSFEESFERKDWEGAIEILRRLDLYLTPAEAESFKDKARLVFKEKLSTLRTQFSVAVQDENWGEAIRIGDEVIRDYPNTQMAKEVRDMMDSLRQRAGQNAPQMAGA